jgi:hypothetical protein
MMRSGTRGGLRSRVIAASIALAVVCLFAAGCVGPRASVDPQELVARVVELRAQGADVDVLWYQGTRDGYDHFRYEFGMRGVRTFRVPAGAAGLVRSFEYSGDNFEWVRVDMRELVKGRFIVQEWRGGGG